MAALPEYHLITAEEFAALPHAGMRLELIKGEIVAMAPAFGDHGKIAMRLGALLTTYVMDHDLGDTYAAETGFLLNRNPDTVRAPDCAFIRKARLPVGEFAAWIDVIPDLVVEVVSSGDRPRQIAEKVQMWLEAGVALIWVVYGKKRVVEVYRPDQPVLTLHDTDALDGDALLPGFSLVVGRIFGA